MRSTLKAINSELAKLGHNVLLAKADGYSHSTSPRMTYNTNPTYSVKRNQQHYMTPNGAVYYQGAVTSSSASYEPVYHVRAADRSRQHVVLSIDAMLVRYTADLQLGGFWKEDKARVSFIPRRSPAGKRVLEAFALLGIPVRLRRDAGACAAAHEEVFS
jgi:hypothetical protein